ncbi:MAG: hypothetical protein HY034_07935 [Nitrospirae bacterium]|nr:hypothetical protein [Nitrospirota bacterium]
MCNRSVALIQREIEKIGISTIGISIVRRFTEEIRPPRAVFLKWPLGHPLGEPFKARQHTTILRRSFNAIKEIKEPGAIIDLPYKWKSKDWEDQS